MNVGVLGSGTMGNGIAQVMADAGHTVILCDVNEEALVRAEQIMHKNLERVYKKQGKDLRDIDKVFERIIFTKELPLLKDSDIVIEAIVENMEIKKKVFAELGALLNEKAIIASNTSGLSITELATAARRPAKVIGMHFFNPVPVMKLVEIVRGSDTSTETYETVASLVESIGKESISIVDAPLFVVNRILVPLINEAIFVLGEGIASAEDIDKGMMLGANHPIGPLALADLIGLDTMLFVAETLLEETGDSKYRVPPLLRKKVRAGHLGRKSGRGFYNYE
ncbi:3-hydroxyacyl-CoA dehydrogenase NAD-binding domain-containing protein [Psychrobacillus lasiicapitis]|uniref:3-hydroxybutyryl-CoA dehydrogenase n=1 Tax=Psychrobacillus lasiicapitis TaxID=1636719 RepID=A0A544T2T1_9BACI|nr:3-hydroxyacyl-CoA dehydrogenase NAD-binding domain-containing protein [Psychrobacillus lasiicapitis]TQR11770.1 3-hydroxybutyryl-CoA dehydrogenase [Psychrobacillus lasiicapitis]GGA19291.1 3-hydroxybutyryl-CoA dehydrogenase [Psychrobacillus lasiicapitis]